MRALAIADNHLGAGADLGRAPGDRLKEQAEVWRRALAIAREEDCDVVLHGGDLFHFRRPTPEQVLAATRPLVEHRAAGGCPVVSVLGNHERSGASEETMPAVLALSEFLHVSSSPEIVGEIGGVTICALPWCPTSWLVASQGGGERDDVNAQAAGLLVNVAAGLRAQVSGPAVLLTHFSISGSSLPNGLPVEQMREPVLELTDLEKLGFDAVIAGHIHLGALLASNPAEPEIPIFYTGSPMPQSFGEADYEHGVWILESYDIGSVKDVGLAPRFVPVASRPLVTHDLDLTTHEGIFDLASLGPVADAVVKVRIRASAEQARRLDVAAMKRSLVEDAGAHKVWAVQLEIEKPERARVEGLSEDLDELAALDLWIEASGLNGDQADALREKTERYLGLVRA